MELMLPLKSKTEAQPHPCAGYQRGEISEYVGRYKNKPESAEILLNKGRFVLKRESGDFPITKIGKHRFSMTQPNESEATEFVLVRVLTARSGICT